MPCVSFRTKWVCELRCCGLARSAGGHFYAAPTTIPCSSSVSRSSYTTHHHTRAIAPRGGLTGKRRASSRITFSVDKVVFARSTLRLHQTSRRILSSTYKWPIKTRFRLGDYISKNTQITAETKFTLANVTRDKVVQNEIRIRFNANHDQSTSLILGLLIILNRIIWFSVLNTCSTCLDCVGTIVPWAAHRRVFIYLYCVVCGVPNAIRDSRSICANRRLQIKIEIYMYMLEKNTHIPRHYHTNYLRFNFWSITYVRTKKCFYNCATSALIYRKMRKCKKPIHRM